MKKTLLFLCLISSICFSQKFETHLQLTTGSSFASSINSENKLALQYAIGIQEYLNISESFALGTQVNYTNTSIRFSKAADGSGIPESSSYYETRIAMHALELPLFAQYKINNKWLTRTGVGLNYRFHLKNDLDYVYSDWFSKNSTRTPLENPRGLTDEKLESFILLSAGRSFTLLSKQFSVLLSYQKTLSKSNYWHTSEVTNNTYTYDLKPQHLALQLELKL